MARGISPHAYSLVGLHVARHLVCKRMGDLIEPYIVLYAAAIEVGRRLHARARSAKAVMRRTASSTFSSEVAYEQRT